MDLVVSSYHAGVNRHHPSYVFWGTGSGLDPKPVLLPTDSASGVMVADYNRDGHDDIFFVCHTTGGNHRTDSFLYWGSKAGFSAERRLPVPTRGVALGHSSRRGKRLRSIFPIRLRLLAVPFARDRPGREPELEGADAA